MTARYYIRFRGRKLGPLTIEKLHSLARRGRFGRHYEVSTNGRVWERAADHPELFADADDGGFDESADDEPLDDFDDLDAPLVDEGPKSGAARRGRTPRGGSAPPPVDADSQAQTSGRRTQGRRRGRGRNDGGTGGAQYGEPPIVDPLMPAAASTGEGRRSTRRRRRGADPAASAPATMPLADDNDVLSPLADGRGSEPDTRATKAPADGVSDEPVRSGKKKKSKPGGGKKKSRGLRGLFGGRKQAEDEAPSPHLEQLHEMSGRLRQLSFRFKDIELIGAGHERLPVVGHRDGGEAIRTLGLLVMLACQAKATDIHLEPKQDGYDARLRVDGMLVQLVHLPKDVAGRVSGVIKVLCEIDFAGQLGIQEGNFSSEAPGRRTDYRISFTPAMHGQKLAIRVLDLDNSPQAVAQLGAPRKMIRQLQSVMDRNAGMILMCGPTGSGKTTTLYSLIRGINVRQRNVMTLEDPVEYRIPGVTQSSIDLDHGRGFADMLRALLRQDPDVILLGEIRDQESAKIAMQATMTGHLVLSTVHAPDTLSTVFRLLDLGADPNMVASSLDIVLAQRLVRVLCDECSRRRRPTPQEQRRLGRLARDTIYEPRGCPKCFNTGFSGRRALFELLSTNEQLKEVMLQSPTRRQLRECMEGTGFVTLREYGHHLVADGATCFSEVDRVIGAE